MEAHHLFYEFKRIIELVAVREIERKEKDEFDRVWSNLLFEELTVLGIKKGYDIELRSALQDSNEFIHTVPLVDYSWKRRENGMLSKIELILQCEWSIKTEVILSAFEKLLVIESHQKILVCQQRTKKEADQLLTKIVSMIDVFETPQVVQNYLIAIWIDDHFEWEEIMS